MIHEGFETGQGIGLLLTVIGHVENGDVAIFLPVPLEEGAYNRSGHTGEGHDVDDSAHAASCKVNRLSDRENGFSLERRIDVVFGLLEKGLGFGFTRVPEGILEQFPHAVFILFLVVIGEENLQEVRKGFLLQASSLGDNVDIEDPLR